MVAKAELSSVSSFNRIATTFRMDWARSRLRPRG
jgi:hypothetical protein